MINTILLIIRTKNWTQNGLENPEKDLPKYSLWMLSDVLEAADELQTGTSLDVFFIRPLDHGFGLCKENVVKI